MEIEYRQQMKLPTVEISTTITTENSKHSLTPMSCKAFPKRPTRLKAKNNSPPRTATNRELSNSKNVNKTMYNEDLLTNKIIKVKSNFPLEVFTRLTASTNKTPNHENLYTPTVHKPVTPNPNILKTMETAESNKSIPTKQLFISNSSISRNNMRTVYSIASPNTEIEQLQAKLKKRDSELEKCKKNIKELQEENNDLRNSNMALLAALRAKEQNNEEIENQPLHLEVPLMKKELKDAKSDNLKLKAVIKYLKKARESPRTIVAAHKIQKSPRIITNRSLEDSFSLAGFSY